MKKELFALIMLIAAAFTASAEHGLTYNVTYNYRIGNYVLTDSTRIDVVPSRRYKENKELVDWIKGNYYNCYIDEIVDEDSEAKDIAIVRKLDKIGGYDIAWPEENTNSDVIIYFKEGREWHKLTRINEPVSLDESVSLTDKELDELLIK